MNQVQYGINKTGSDNAVNAPATPVYVSDISSKNNIFISQDRAQKVQPAGFITCYQDIVVINTKCI